MKLTVKDITGQGPGRSGSEISADRKRQGTEAVHQTVVAYRAAQRMGTACTKNVGEVAGTNKKPWRQKGTGRARAGSFQSPFVARRRRGLWTEAARFSKKVSRTTRQLALRKALSERLKAGDVLVVDDFKLTSPKTKEFLGVLSAATEGTALVVDARRRQESATGLAQCAGSRTDHGRFAQHLPGAAQRQIGLHPRRVRKHRATAEQGIT
jgi:50S ribosomal protein L4